MENLRNSGRTRAMVMSLPDDGKPFWVVIHDWRICNYVSVMIHDLRGERILWCARFIVDRRQSPGPLRGSDQLTGIDPTRIFVDHAVEEVRRRLAA